jgi:hypothetical protein
MIARTPPPPLAFCIFLSLIYRSNERLLLVSPNRLHVFFVTPLLPAKTALFFLMSQLSCLRLIMAATICKIRIREKVLLSVGISPESLAISCVASSTLGTRLFDLIPGSQVRRKRNLCKAEVNQAGNHLKN